MMNDHQIAFIICTNDSVLLNESLMYISLLNVPDEYSIDVITIKDAKSMCAGYNSAMNESDAKYKIYMHQDVFITDRDFLHKLLEIFSTDERIGMVGEVGAPILDSTAIMWDMPRVGNLSTDTIDHLDFGFHENEIIDVACIDGLLMATQVDLPWRENIFSGFDFYDVSQSFEFRKHGYRVVVKDVSDDGIIHDDGVNNMFSYEKWRQIFIREYGDLLSSLDYRNSRGIVSGVELWQSLYLNRDEYLEVYSELISYMDRAIAANDIKACLTFFKMVEDIISICRYSNTVIRLFYISSIVIAETAAGEKNTFISDVDSVETALHKYQRSRQMLIRLRVGLPEWYCEDAEKYLDRELTTVARSRISELVDRKLGIIK